MYVRLEGSENGPDGSPYYVGKGKGVRAFNHTGHGLRTPKNKHSIVMVANGLTEAEAFARERTLIAQYGRLDQGTGCLRNRTDGGEGASGHRHSAETKEKLRLANVGLQKSAETRAKLSRAKRGKPNPHRGYPHSQEQRAKVSARLKGRPSNNPLGHKHTPESRAKESAQMKVAWARRKALGTVPSKVIPLRIRRLTLGLCRECTQPRESSSKNFCSAHLASHREEYKKSCRKKQDKLCA